MLQAMADAGLELFVGGSSKTSASGEMKFSVRDFLGLEVGTQNQCLEDVLVLLIQNLTTVL